MNKYIDRVGLEVECMTSFDFEDDTPDHINDFWKLKEDGSVEADDNDGKYYPREYASIPFDSMNKLNKETGRLYSECVEYVNSTCGLHIHVSLKEKGYYQRLANMDFYKHFLHTLELTPMYQLNKLLRSRMTGTNGFCRGIKPEELSRLVGQEGDRYKLLNWKAYSKFHTLEFRVFPAMHKAESVTQAVRYTTKAINSFLDAQNIKRLWKEAREITAEEQRTPKKEVITVIAEQPMKKQVITLSQIARRGF